MYSPTYAQISITPLNGVDMGNGIRATYIGTGIDYSVQVATEDSIANVISFKAGTDDLKYTVSEGKISVENYSYPASQVCSNEPLSFELIYTVMKDSVEAETSMTSATQYVTVYTEPVCQLGISNLGEDISAIKEGTFQFQAEGVDETTGDPSGWSYVWTATESGSQNDKVAKWNFVNETSTVKTYTVTLKAINKIHGSSDEHYSRSVESCLGVTVYPALGISVGSAPKNVLVGDTMNFVVNLNGGMSGKWQNVQVTVNGQDIEDYELNSNIIQFSYVASEQNNLYSIQVSSENQPDGMSNSVAAPSLSYSVTSWPLPGSAAPDVTSYELRGEYDPSFNLVCSTFGGCEATTGTNGWKYQWSLDGVVQKETDSSYFIDTSVSENIDQVYKVVAEHYVDGVVRYSTEYSWNIVLWAKPSLPTFEGLDAYYNENTTVQVIPHGGYNGDDAKGGWKYVWYKDGNEVEVVNADQLVTVVFPAPAGGEEEFLDNSYSLKATNYWVDGTEWDSFMVPAPIVVHPTPMVIVESVPSDVYYNTSVKIQIMEIGGIKEGQGKWQDGATYNVTRQGEDYGREFGCSVTRTGSIVTLSMMDRYTENVGQNVEVLHVHLVSKNGYGSNEKTIENDFDINIWPKAIFAESMEQDLKIREGDKLLINAATPLSGGCLSSNGKTLASYEYSFDGKMLTDEDVSDESYYAVTPISIRKKTTKSVPVECKVNIISPNGEVWDSKKYSTNAIVYGRPAEPVNISLKGNGTSKTYILDMSMSDSQLESEGYRYTVASESGKVYYYGAKRYGVCSSVSADENVLGATYWVYNDGSTIYSDFVSKEGVRQHCSWNDFTGRGPVTRSASDMSDGIEDAIYQPNEESVYNILGRKVLSPAKGSLYIKNGKKYIAK